MLRDALLENIHRANLNPLEEAAAYQQLLEEFGATHEELARRIGRSRPQISNTIRLLNLPAQVQRRVAAGVLSAGHARALLSLDDADAQEQLARRIVAEGLSVRATEETRRRWRSPTGPAKTPGRKRRPKPHAPALTDLADRLSDRFDTRVKVDIGRSKGKITIEFATVDDLERIVGHHRRRGRSQSARGVIPRSRLPWQVRTPAAKNGGPRSQMRPAVSSAGAGRRSSPEWRASVSRGTGAAASLCRRPTPDARRPADARRPTPDARRPTPDGLRAPATAG